MTHPLDAMLRTTVRDLADEARPGIDFAGAALARGRRLRRRRRQTTGAVAAVMTLAAVATVPMMINRPHGPAPVAPPATTYGGPLATSVWRTGPVDLPGGWVLAGAGTGIREGAGVALERSRGIYVAPRSVGGEVVPAPRGSYALLINAAWPGTEPGPRLGLWEMDSGTVRWVHNDPPLSRPSWSADGMTIVFDAPAADGTAGFAVLDIGDDTLMRHRVDGERFRCMGDCTYVWAPGDTEVALSTIAPDGSSGFAHLQLFSARTGAPSRTLPVNGAISSDLAWSPDGAQVLVSGSGSTELVDVASGITVSSIPESRAFFVAKDRILGRGDAAVLRDLTGKELQRTALPDELGDQVDMYAGPAG